MTIPLIIGEVPADNPFYTDGKVRLGLNGQFLDINPSTARAVAVQLILSAEKVTAPLTPERPTPKRSLKAVT